MRLETQNALAIQPGGWFIGKLNMTTDKGEAARKAWATRKLNASGKAAVSEENVRLSGLDLSLLVQVSKDHIELRFDALDETGTAFPSGLATTERGLTALSWGGALVNGEYLAATCCQVDLLGALSEWAFTVSKLAVELDAALASALEDSDDYSLPFLANWLASTF